VSLDFGEISNLTHDYSIRPLISKSCIASTINSLWLTADLLLDKQIEGGVLKNGILCLLILVKLVTLHMSITSTNKDKQTS
jgi:hypothetical protein